MPDKPHCLLITGMGHSGTRLMSQMFAKHPDISVPEHIINAVAEYTPLHQFFITSMDKTPLHSDRYNIDYEELRFLMDSYMAETDPSKPFVFFKFPYYPLNCLDFFTEYFHTNVSFLNVRRPRAKVLNSFLQKGEDRSLFCNNPVELIRQVKKLPASSRQKFLAKQDFSAFVEVLYNTVEKRIADWNKSHPEMRFIDVDIESLATSSEGLTEVLQLIGLSPEPAELMQSVVDKNRLLVRFTSKLRRHLPQPIKSGVKLLRS